MKRVLARRDRLPALLLVTLLLAFVGCDVVEKQDETRQYVGRYAAEAAPDTLQVAFTPDPRYDEEDESPYLPDTTVDLLQMGGSLELTLAGNGSSANKGGVTGRLTIPETVVLDSDSTYALMVRMNATYEGKYIAVVDRVFMREMYQLQPRDTTEVNTVRTTLPLPQEWFRSRDGGLSGSIGGVDVLGQVYFFNWATGRQDSMITTIGSLAINARISRK